MESEPLREHIWVRFSEYKDLGRNSFYRFLTLPLNSKRKNNYNNIDNNNNNNNNNDNNNNGNFICVFECTIVNLATYRQFTNAAWDWIIQKKKRKERKKNEKKRIQNCNIPIPISTTKDVIRCSNGYNYHRLDYIKLLLFVNANSIHHV